MASDAGRSIFAERDRAEEVARQAEWQARQEERSHDAAAGLARGRIRRIDTQRSRLEDAAAPLRAARDRTVTKLRELVANEPSDAQPHPHDRWRRECDDLRREIAEIDYGASTHVGFERQFSYLGRGLTFIERDLERLAAERREWEAKLAGAEAALAELRARG